MKLGENFTEKEIDELRKTCEKGEFSFKIPPLGPWVKEFDTYKFISEDKGKTWKCVRTQEGELTYESVSSGVTYITSDRKKSRDFYTRHKTVSGGKPDFNPTTETGGKGGGKTLG